MDLSKRMFAAALAVAALGATTLADASEEAGTAVAKKVKVGDYYFKGKTVTIAPGAAVKWVWRAEDTHNVRFKKVPKGAKKPKGCSLRSKGSCVRRLKAKGTYSYICSLHVPEMRGKVRVR